MHPTLLIVDGHNLLFQMFFGMPSRITNSKGICIHGVIGFVGAILKMYEFLNPTHMIVLFDSENTSNRSSVMPEYKANRTDYSNLCDNDNPFSQLPFIMDALSYLNISYQEVQGAETDDIVASIVKKYNEQTTIYISSFDSDFFQLLGDNVKIFRYRGASSYIIDTRYLLEKYNIMPSAYPLFKSLTGDKADNIKGVEGIGEKRASAIVNVCQNKTGSSLDFSLISNAKLRQVLQDNLHKIELNLSLIKLNGNYAVPFTLDNMRVCIPTTKTMEVIRAINLY